MPKKNTAFTQFFGSKNSRIFRFVPVTQVRNPTEIVQKVLFKNNVFWGWISRADFPPVISVWWPQREQEPPSNAQELTLERLLFKSTSAPIDNTQWFLCKVPQHFDSHMLLLARHNLEESLIEKFVRVLGICSCSWLAIPHVQCLSCVKILETTARTPQPRKIQSSSKVTKKWLSGSPPQSNPKSNSQSDFGSKSHFGSYI